MVTALASTIAIIFFLSIVQSIFGVGLLVFGTPLLYLVNHDFAQTVSLLLPASLSISLIQTWKFRGEETAFIRELSIWCLIPLLLAFPIPIIFQARFSIEPVVASVLYGFVLLRLSPRLFELARIKINDSPRVWLVLMGVVHGLSNLGGGILVLLAAFRHPEKARALRTVAFSYSVFAALQLTVLLALRPDLLSWNQLVSATIASLVFLTIGQRVFQRISESQYKPVFTFFMLLFAVAMTLKALKIF